MTYEEEMKKTREYREYVDQKMQEAFAKQPDGFWKTHVQLVQHEGKKMLDASIQATDELLKEMEEEEKKAFEDFKKAGFSEESKEKFLEQIDDMVQKRWIILGQQGRNFSEWVAAIPEKDLKKYTELMESRVNALHEQAEKLEKLLEMKKQELQKYDEGSEEWKKCDAEITALTMLSHFRQSDHRAAFYSVINPLRKGESAGRMERAEIQSGDAYAIESLLHESNYMKAKGKAYQKEKTSNKELKNKSDSLTKGSETNDETGNRTLDRFATRIGNEPAQQDTVPGIGKSTTRDV